MAFLLLRDDRCLAHDPGSGHPESRRRLEAVFADLDRDPPAETVVRAPTPADEDVLARVHTAEHLERLAATTGRHVHLDADTVASEASWEAARLAAGATCDAARAVLAGEAEGAFALVRPPGHHAEADRAMGFCLLNNVAVAAEAAIAEHGVERVLIVDPDVHHGNGTQHVFEDRADVLYVSSHRLPFYPGTGGHDEIGRGEGAGYTVNLPLGGGATDADLLHVWTTVADPVIRAFEPQLILVSAGYDTWQHDPLGGCAVTERGYEAFFALVRAWADAHCPGRVALTLEGGYDPAGLALGVRAAIEVLAGTRAAEPRVSGPASPRTTASALQTRAHLLPHWRALA